MGIKHGWLIENFVVLDELYNDVSVDEMHQNNTDMFHYVESGQGPVHIICKLDGLGRFPANVSAVAQSAQQYLRHPSMGWFIVMGANNPLIGFVGTVVANVSNLKFKQVKDLSELVDLLSRIDPRLDEAALAKIKAAV